MYSTFIRFLAAVYKHSSGRLIDLLIDWLVDWLIDWLIGRLIDWLIEINGLFDL